MQPDQVSFFPCPLIGMKHHTELRNHWHDEMQYQEPTIQKVEIYNYERKVS